MRTGKEAASTAGRLLSKSRSKTVRRVAASDLPQRDALGLKAGSKVEIEMQPGRLATLKPAGKPRKSDYAKRIDKVRGTLKLNMSTDEIMELLRGD
jgi:hypothetical protein